MLILVASILILGVIAALFALFTKGTAKAVVPESSCATCNGENDKCEQECMLEAAVKDIEYYADEELDRFAGRDADDYTDEEVEEFAEVLYTLKEEEVKGWNRSLILRNINIPNRLKDELVAMLSMLAIVVGVGITFVSCSNQKNTAQTRWWHSFNARYNTYYNGSVAYIDGSLEKERGNKDNYTEFIPLYTVGNKASRELGKGNFETAITKSQKAIKQHSIKKRPEWTKNRKKTERDIEWLSRREYNPFIWKAWMLMGRSQFYKGDFDEAAATFSYMSRLFRTQPAIYGKARAWLAKCYIEQDWLYDAEDIIRNMTRDSIDWRAQKEWDYTLADYYLHTGDYDQATAYLRKVIKHERRAVQRAREYFLLGQVYAAQGKTMDAYNAFRKVPRQNPPYELEFNARIAMTEVMPAGHMRQRISKLKSMARSDKNKDYLDQVYYAMGNIYLAEKDTTHAIAAYEMGNEKATRAGIEKGVLLLHLGDLFWEVERYSDAKRCYGEAIGLLDKERKDYEQLSHRSKVLDELVPYTDAVHLQDSLQALAQMSEADRNAAIDRVIEALKKKEKEERKKQQEQLAQQQQAQNGGNNMAQNTPQMPTQNTNGAWYFYNPMSIQQGKQTFRQQWGTRPNEDNWRRINKTVVASFSDDVAETTDSLDADGNPVVAGEGEEGSETKNDSVASDPHKREYYLAQIPFTEEQLASSNQILSDGLFHSGIIFKDKLDNLRLSEKALARLTTDFPDFAQTDEAYYHLFLLYSRQGKFDEAAQYKSLLSSKYHDSQWSKIINDPYFLENALHGTHLEDSLYASTYDAFKADDHKTISLNYTLSEERFPLGAHRDKFLFINGLSQLNQNNADSCLHSMQRVVKEYPQSEVAGIAGMIVKGVEAGKRMHGAKFDIGSLWDRRSSILEGSEEDSMKVFSDDRLTDFVFLMTYDPDSINSENQLLYELARYNFTNYLVRNFDIDIEEYSGMHRLLIRGFRSLDEALMYTRQLYRVGTITHIASRSRNIIISEKNLPLLGTYLSYNDYDEFYDKHFAPLPEIKEPLLTEPIIDPELYNPENTPSPKPSTQEEDVIEDNTTTTTTIEIPAAEEEDIPATTIEIPAAEEEDTPATTIEIPVVEEDTPSATTMEILDTDAPSIRQQINNEIIDIIDEEPNESTKETPSPSIQIDDDEYFDLDGF